MRLWCSLGKISKLLSDQSSSAFTMAEEGEINYVSLYNIQVLQNTLMSFGFLFWLSQAWISVKILINSVKGLNHQVIVEVLKAGTCNLEDATNIAINVYSALFGSGKFSGGFNILVYRICILETYEILPKIAEVHQEVTGRFWNRERKHRERCMI